MCALNGEKVVALQKNDAVPVSLIVTFCGEEVIEKAAEDRKVIHKRTLIPQLLFLICFRWLFYGYFIKRINENKWTLQVLYSPERKESTVNVPIFGKSNDDVFLLLTKDGDSDGVTSPIPQCVYGHTQVLSSIRNSCFVNYVFPCKSGLDQWTFSIKPILIDWRVSICGACQSNATISRDNIIQFIGS